MLYLDYILLRYVLIYNLKVSFNFHLTFLQSNVIKMKARHYQHLMTDELVCNFGFMSCNELTNIKVNVKDKKLTPLDPTMKVHKKTLTNIG